MINIKLSIKIEAKYLLIDIKFVEKSKNDNH